jgi:hypothetical protein
VDLEAAQSDCRRIVNTFSQDRGRVIKVTGHRSFEIDFVRVRVRQYDPGLMLSVIWLAHTAGEWNQP